MLSRARKAISSIAAAFYPGASSSRTGAQTQSNNSSAYLYDQIMAGAGGVNCLPTWDKAPRGDIRTWRRMCDNPTIALALAAAKAPAKAAPWSVTVEKGAPAGAEKLITEYVLPLRPAILRDGLRCVEYGWQPFEVIWDRSDGGIGPNLIPAKLKPLLPDITEILTDKETGAFTGLRNTGVDLAPMDALVISTDGEAGNLYGHSRLERVREKAWWPWEQIVQRLAQYTNKSAGIIARVQYPEGVSIDPTGKEVDNGLIAQGLLRRMSQGGGVAMPTKLHPWAEAMLARSSDPSKLLAWQIDFIEAKLLHGEEFLAGMTKFESLMVRGIYGPERGVLEGSTGTKAEAGVHGDIGVAITQDTLDQVLCALNWHLVDKVLVLNYGPQAAGTVKIEAAPLADEAKALLTDIIEKVLTAPANADIATALIDFPGGCDQLGLPVIPGAEVPEPDPTPTPDPSADPSANPNDPATIAASIWRNSSLLRGKR